MDKVPFVFFLDMDGVVNNTRVTLSQPEHIGPSLYGNIDPICVAFINRWAEYIHSSYNDEVQIVLTTTWRGAHESYRTVDMMLGVMNMRPLVHKDFKTRRTGMTIDGVSDIRGNQISDWLKDHPDVTKWIIIDDDSDFTDEQKVRHVHTDVYDGILMRHHVATIDIIDKIYKGEI